MNELPIPPAVGKGSHPIELARIWAVDGAQHVSIQSGVWSDPAAWGILLADFMRHIADAYSRDGEFSKAEVLTRVHAAFNAEWSDPTDEPSGDFMP